MNQVKITILLASFIFSTISPQPFQPSEQPLQVQPIIHKLIDPVNAKLKCPPILQS